MSTIDQGKVDKFLELFQEYSTTKDNLKNLEKIKDTIADERFQAQKHEYDNTISRLLPEIETLKMSIEETLQETTLKYQTLEADLNKKNGEIEQEKIMFDAGAISKEDYKENTSKLHKEQKDILTRHQETDSQITVLKDALSGKKSKGSIQTISATVSDSIENNGPSNTTADFPGAISPPKGFSKDFNKGCLAIILIALLVPMLGLLVASIKGMALIVIPILGIIIIVAIFGKSINFIQKIWR